MTSSKDKQDVKKTYNGTLFKMNDEWYCYGFNQGEFGLGYSAPAYIDKSNPMKVPWSADEVVTTGGYHVFIRQGRDWFAMGDNHSGQLGIEAEDFSTVHIPKKIPLEGITQIITSPGKTYLKAKNHWYVCGDNSYGELGIGRKIRKVYKLTRINWRPKKIFFDNCTTHILMEDGDWYELGLNQDSQLGLGRKINGKYPYIIDHPIKSKHPGSEQDFETSEKDCSSDDEYEDSCEIDDLDTELSNKKHYLPDDKLPDLQSLLNGKFEPLKPYFHNLEMKDLISFSQEGILQIVTPFHKLLMQIFIDDHLWAIFKRDEDRDYSLLDRDFSLECDENGVLELETRIVSSSGQFQQPVTLDYLHSIIKENPKIKKLNLAGNTFVDCDIKMIKKIVDSLPNLNTLDLTGNSLTDSSSIEIKNMLMLPNIKFINISCSLLASIEGKDFMNSLSEQELKKLIWIPKCWVLKKSWETVIDNKKYLDLILDLHKKHYDLD